MFSFPFIKKDSTDKFFLIFDIGSTSVGGALVKISDNNKPKVLYNVRKQIIPQSILNHKKLVSFMNQSLMEVIEDIKKNGFSYLHPNKIKKETTIESVFCFLSSPWHVSQAKTLNFKKKTPFVISRDFLEEVIRNEEKIFKNSNLAKYSEKLEEMEIIERKITNIKIDGYRVNDPYLKKIKEAEISLFVSLASKKITGKIRDIISSSFFVDKDIKFDSFSLPTFLTIRELFTSEDNFLFVDVSGEVSEISIANDSALNEIFSFPIGRNSLLREIQDAFKTNFQEALSLLNIYRKKKTNEKITLKLEKVLKKVEDKWSNTLQESLMLLSEKYFIPQNIFITADDDVAHWFVKFFSAQGLINISSLKQPFNIIFINTDTLEDFCDFDKDVVNDPFLILETVFLDKLFKQN